MACEFCDWKDKPVPMLIGRDFGVFVYIDGQKMVMKEYGGILRNKLKKTTCISIVRCPMCGDNLGGDA